MEKYQGLTSAKALEKHQSFGKNEIVVKKQFSAVSLLAVQFLTLINAILFITSFLAFFVGDSLDAYFILAIIIINALFGFFQEYRAEKSLEKLKAYTSETARVIRDGIETQIDTKELVPGDLVILSEGDRIPADGVLKETHHIEVDESILTGESLPLTKNFHDLVYLGTLVITGRGYFEVLAIGTQTKFGQIAQSLVTIKNDKTPLQKQLNTLGIILTAIAFSIAFLLIPIGIMQGKMLVPLILLAVSIGIAAVPEGLPAVITIALALGTNRMAKQKAIVRKMPSIETLGAIQVILIDKTGTLTKNTMRVKKVWTNTKKDITDIQIASILGNTAALITKAKFLGKDTQPPDWDIVGDRTDGALLLWTRQENQQLENEIKKGRIVDEFVFDPKRKTITTVFEKNDTYHVFVRGAPELILKKSKNSTKDKETIKKAIEENAKNGLRIIGFGTKILHEHSGFNRDQLENDLTFLGIVCLYDPPRDEAKLAVKAAKQAGVRVIMVTGDNELTALAIAKEIELVEKDEDVITGEKLDILSDDQLTLLLGKTRIFARTKPHDKLRLVSLLKNQGYITGVTGDGVNDALALKKADVGVAMGEKGTDVAKEASDIILVDDNFATLVKAIEEGRTIYRNIVTAIVYLLSGNLSELSLVFGASLLGLPTPLLPTQILWINLVTDSLPALALASDTKSPKILSEQPRDPKSPILTSHRLSIIATIGFGLAALLIGLYAFLLPLMPEIKAQTIIFNTLIFLHLIMAFVVRKQSPFRINKLFIFSAVIIVFLQIIITTVPALQKIFHLSI